MNEQAGSARGAREALELGVAQGMIGGDLDAHMAHAHAFVDAYQQVAGEQAPELVVDLGSGGGLPAFVLLERWPAAMFVLVEGRTKRAELLDRGSRIMGVEDRVTVHAGDAQVAMTAPEWHGQADLVTARSFGAPAITAECATHFLRHNAWVIISEPPEETGADRWPETLLTPLGLEAHPVHAANHHYIALHKTSASTTPPRPRKPMQSKPLA